MTGNKLLQLVMPSQYRQGFTYPIKPEKLKKHKTLADYNGKINHLNWVKRVRKNGQTMLRRALRRDMLNELFDNNE
jgi:hypothetical protein